MNQLNTLRERAANYGLLSLSDAELIKVAKMPENYTESIQFKAAKELIRRQELNEKPRKQITGSQDAAKFFSFLQNLQHEEFHVMYLRTNNTVICSSFISKGSEAGTVVNFKEIVLQASRLKAKGVIIAHNHPSGNNEPSHADKDITRKIKEVLTLIDSKLIDHVIICGNKYYSFADEGQI
jgi:DNA repair protein RadC